MGTPANPTAVNPPAPSPHFQAAFQVQFKTTHVDPPSPVYVTAEDSIQLFAGSNVSNPTLRIMGKLLRAPLPNWNKIDPSSDPKNPTPLLLPPEISPIDETFTVTTTFVNPIATIPLAEGFLLSLGFLTSTTESTGQWCFVHVALVRGGGPTPANPRTLFSGYVSAVLPLGWPDIPPMRTIDGAGIVRSITGSTPAAGAEISETMTAGTRRLITSFTASLTASAAVANRAPTFIIDDGANTLFQSPSFVAQTAGQAFRYSMGSQLMTTNPLSTPLVLYVPIPLMLRGNLRIRTSTIGIQAADQWSAPQYEVAEWAQEQ